MPAPASPRSSRRQFIRSLGCGLAACSLGGLAPRLLAVRRGPQADHTPGPRALILIQLEGGHDGLSTFVPLQDDDYHRLRPGLAIAPRDLIALGAATGMHRAGRGLESLFKDGRLAVVHQAGYANPSPSHFRATEIWHTASAADEVVYSGWLGRCFSRFEAEGRSYAANHGGLRPRVFAREEDRPWRGQSRADATRRPLQYAGDPAAVQLAEIAERAGAGAGTEIYFVPVPGFDTHFAQADRHAAQLDMIAGSLHALQRRLERRGVDGRVLTVVFSEFGRTLAENGQGGTDHGAGGPLLLLGAPVRGGFHGGADPVDFRRVFATVVERWLRVPSAQIFGHPFTPLDLLA